MAAVGLVGAKAKEMLPMKRSYLRRADSSLVSSSWFVRNRSLALMQLPAQEALWGQKSWLWRWHLTIPKQLLTEKRVAPLCLPFPLLSLKQKHMLPVLLLEIPGASVPPTGCQNLPPCHSLQLLGVVSTNPLAPAVLAGWTVGVWLPSRAQPASLLPASPPAQGWGKQTLGRLGGLGGALTRPPLIPDQFVCMDG